MIVCFDFYFFLFGLDCGRIINFFNGGFEEIKMILYIEGKVCIWFVKVNIILYLNR